MQKHRPRLPSCRANGNSDRICYELLFQVTRRGVALTCLGSHSLLDHNVFDRFLNLAEGAEFDLAYALARDTETLA